jgi:hypothetical protein
MADASARPPRERGHNLGPGRVVLHRALILVGLAELGPGVALTVTRICPSLAVRGASGSSTFASFVRNPSRARSARHSASTRAGGDADGERYRQWHEHDLVEYPSAGTNRPHFEICLAR